MSWKKITDWFFHKIIYPLIEWKTKRDIKKALKDIKNGKGIDFEKL